jgi:hypothetical protein
MGRSWSGASALIQIYDLAYYGHLCLALETVFRLRRHAPPWSHRIRYLCSCPWVSDENLWSINDTLVPIPYCTDRLRHLESTGWLVWLVGVFGGDLFLWTWFRLRSFLLVSPILVFWLSPIHFSSQSEGAWVPLPEWRRMVMGWQNAIHAVDVEMTSLVAHILRHQDLASDPLGNMGLLRRTRLELLSSGVSNLSFVCLFFSFL